MTHRKINQNDLMAPILIFLVGVLITVIAVQLVDRGQTEEIKVKTELNAKIYAGYLAADIERGVAVTNAVEQAVISGGGRIDSFSTIAKNMMEDYIQSIQIAPDGIVTEIYPAKGNEAGLGNLIDLPDARGRISRYARDHDVVIMQGPFHLAQGGDGLAIRNPIYLDRDGRRVFWGFSIVLIRVPEIFSNTVNALSRLGYAYTLSKTTGPEDRTLVKVFGSEAPLPIGALTLDFKVKDVDWQLAVAPEGGWRDTREAGFVAATVLLFFALLAGAVFFILKRNRVISEYEREMLERNVLTLENERRLSRQVQLYAAAMGVDYPLAIDIDYLHDRYQVVESDEAVRFPAETGTVAAMLEAGVSTIADAPQAQTARAIFNREAVIKAFRSGRTEVSLRHRRWEADGSVRWMETKVVCLECSDTAVRGLALSKCIDDEVRQEALRVEAERANHAKSTFLMRMSHDIRTPLNGILGMMDVSEQHPNDAAMQAQCRTKSREAAQVLLELVNEVLDMGKLESGEVMLEHVPFDLEEAAQSGYDLIERMAASRGIEVVRETTHVDCRRLMGSPVHVKRVFMNILSNAVKYNKDHGKIFLTLRSTPMKDGRARVQFTCRDTGIGMAKEFLARLFDPFTQEKSTARSQYGGTGLGMAIAKSLTEKMGGTIAVQSVQGEGTTFDVVIPFDIDATPAEETAVDAEETASVKGLKILLAEDNDLNLEIAKLLLEEAGATVVEARNGREAAEAFEKSAPFTFDAVLMDIMMPEMNGHEATRRIRAMNRPDAPLVPVIAMTANAFAEDRMAARAAGMTEHLAKPLDTRLVIRTIARCVAESRAAQQGAEEAR